MGILGGRYGYVPPGSDHSITADEVRYGVLDRLHEHGRALADPAGDKSWIGDEKRPFNETPFHLIGASRWDGCWQG